MNQKPLVKPTHKNSNNTSSSKVERTPMVPNSQPRQLPEPVSLSWKQQEPAWKHENITFEEKKYVYVEKEYEKITTTKQQHPQSFYKKHELVYVPKRSASVGKFDSIRASLVVEVIKDPEILQKFEGIYGKNTDIDLEELVKRAEKFVKRHEIEKRRAEKNLSIYHKRDEIMEQVTKNKFSIVVGDTGCGKSTQLPQYLLEHYEQVKGGKILWVLPRKLAVLSLSQRVCEEMGAVMGEEIGYEVPNKSKASSETILKFVTDSVLINELIAKRARIGPNRKIQLNYSMIVLDEVHERNLYTDILLASLKEIALQSNLKLLVTSATINEAVFERYFDTKAIQVKGRPFPVEIEYNPFPENLYPAVHVANNVIRIAREMERPGYTYKGHILIFTAGIDDIIKLQTKLAEMLEQHHFDLSKYEILPLHGLLTPDEQQAVFLDTDKTKIILSTRMAETALTINGVRAVIDVGYDKEKIYDAIKRMTIVEEKSIPQSSAIQRTGRAGRTGPGLCVRLYTVEDYERLSRNKVSEIQRMNLGKVVLKLKALGVANIKQFDFIEKPNEEVLAQTIEHLIELGALAAENEGLTLIGEAMLKLETDPDFSRVILEGLRRGCEQEIIDIIAMIGVNPRLYNRGFDDDTREAADKKKLGFCHEKGDLLTLLSIYRFWLSKAKPERQKWCTSNYFSYYALNEAFKMVKGLEKTLEVVKVMLKPDMPRVEKKDKVEEEKKEEQQVPSPIVKDNNKVYINKKEAIEQAAMKSKQEDMILKCFLTAFYPNVCKYTEIPRLGYTLLRDNITLRLHGASSMSLAQDYPKYLFCIDINKTTCNNSKLVSVMNQEWLDELFPKYQNNPRLKFLANSYSFTHFTIENLSRPVLGYFVYQKLPAIKAMAENTETTFFPDLNQEKLLVYTASSSIEDTRRKFDEILRDIRLDFQNEVKEVPVVLKTRGVFKDGGEVKELLLNNETISFSFDGFHPSFTKQRVKELFGEIGDVVSVFTEIDKATNLARGVVNMKSYQDVKKVLSFFNEYRLNQYGDPHNKSGIIPVISPISYKLSSLAKRALRLRIEWFVGKSQHVALLRYIDGDAAEMALETAAQMRLTLEGEELEVILPGESAYELSLQRTVKDRKVLVMKNLEPVTDQIDVEKFARTSRLDRGLLAISMFRVDDFGEESVDNMRPEVYKEIIRKTIVEEIGVEGSQICRIEAHHPKQKKAAPGEIAAYTDYRRRVEVDVYDLEVAKKIIGYFDGNTRLKELTGGRMHCSLSFSRKFVLKESKYKVIKGELDMLVEKFREDKGNSVTVIKEAMKGNFNSFGFGGGVQATSNDVGIRVITADPLTLDECCNAINPLVWGAPFYLKTFAQCQRVEVKSTKDNIRRIEYECDVNIEHDKKRRVLKVNGVESNRERAITALEKLLNDEPKGFQKGKVSFRYKPVRHILENNGALLVEIEGKYGVRVTYSLLAKDIYIFGNGERVSQAEKEVSRLVNAYGSKEVVSESECPICMGPFIDGYRLQICGHKYCFSCLEAEMNETLNNNPEFPICCSQCASEGKKVTICLRDLSNLLTAGTVQTLWDRSIAAHLLRNQDQYFKCLSPNCPQIFRVGQQKWFSCDYCLRSYCKECKDEAHGEGECDKTTKNDMLKVLEGEGTDVKECPKCSFIIERNGGCSKMRCVMCQVVFCWICREVCRNAIEVYKHLEEVHQAYGVD